MRARAFLVMSTVAAMLAAGRACFAAEEHAAAAMDGFKEKFSEMDKDGDGRITRGEYEDFILKDARIRFDKADKNKDGTVSQPEAEEALKARAEEIREKMREWRERQEKLRHQP